MSRFKRQKTAGSKTLGGGDQCAAPNPKRGQVSCRTLPRDVGIQIGTSS